MFIEIKKALHLKLALLSLTILLIAVLITGFKQYHNREIIIYNNASNTTIQLIAGRKNYVISAHKINSDDFLYRQIQDVKRKKRLATPIFLVQNEPFEDNYLMTKNGICFFEDKSIYYGTEPANLPPNFSPSFLISTNNFKYKKLNFDSKIKIISTQKVFLKDENIHIHSLPIAGAFHEKWN